ncbi:LemA family protein, partial [Vibrio anguillarum]
QHEERVFVEVTNARAKVGSIQVNTDSLKDPQTLQTFQSVQGELSTALSRLMIVSERYPDLKADGLFQNLQAQLEGTENRITVARNRYVQTIQQYNSLIRVFPNNLTAMMFDYEVKPNFKVENENAISTAPTIEFGSN